MSFLNAGPQHRAWNLFLGDTGQAEDDPFAANVRWLMHFDDVGTPNLFVDAASNTWIRSGPTALNSFNSPTLPRFGAGSLETTNTDGSVASCTINTTSSFQLPIFGSGNLFTLEGWILWSGDVNAQPRIGGVQTNGFPSFIDLYLSFFGGGLRFETNLAGVFDAISVVITSGVWHFVAATFDGTTKRLYVDGFLAASSVVAPGAAQILSVGRIGQLTGSISNAQFIDESRLTIGVARYTGATCPVPTGPFPDPGPPTISPSWNPADAGAAIVLTDSDQLASETAASESVRSVTSHSNDGTAYYAEITIDTGSAQHLVGLMRAAASLAIYPGGDANGFGFYTATGARYTSNIGAAYGAAANPGDVIGVLFTGGNLRFSINGSDQGIAFAGLVGDYFLGWGSATGGPGTRAGRINTGPAFLFQPVGAVAWG